MAYTKQTWVDGVTPLDATHMNYMETGLESMVDTDNVVAAASQLVASKLLAGDAQPAFRVLGDGKHEWGVGGSTAPDMNLYRGTVPGPTPAAGLIADGPLKVGGLASVVASGITMFVGARSSEAGMRLRFGSDGAIQWADGTTMVADTVIYRAAADLLATDDAFRVIRLGTTDEAFSTQIGGSLYFTIRQDGRLSWLADTYLYRSAGGKLTTDGALYIAGTHPSSSLYTTLSFWVRDVGTREVSVGAADSGGSGFRMVRVPN